MKRSSSSVSRLPRYRVEDRREILGTLSYARFHPYMITVTPASYMLFGSEAEAEHVCTLLNTSDHSTRTKKK